MYISLVFSCRVTYNILYKTIELCMSSVTSLSSTNAWLQVMNELARTYTAIRMLISKVFIIAYDTEGNPEELDL